MKKNIFLFLGICLLVAGCSSKISSYEKESFGKSNQNSLNTSSVNDGSTVQSESTSQSVDQEMSSITEDKTDTNKNTSIKKMKVYTESEKQAISNEFLEWAGYRAALGGMATNGAYFNHGASGRGDWYARTPDGLVLVQQQDPDSKRGYDYYSIHAIGGVVFYTSKYGTTGKTEEVNDSSNNPSTAAGFNEVAELNQPIIKYLLGDNGVVYEFNGTGAFSSGFYVTDNEGDFDYWPEEQVPFFISNDQAAQAELQKILLQYE